MSDVEKAKKHLLEIRNGKVTKQLGIDIAHIDIAIKALEYRVPVAPILQFKSDPDQICTEGYCIYCDNWVTSASKYCDNCGQALLWEKP